MSKISGLLSGQCGHMERQKRDIPKFLDNSRVISPENKQWWSNFFANENKTYSNAELVDVSKRSGYLTIEGP